MDTRACVTFVLASEMLEKEFVLEMLEAFDNLSILENDFNFQSIYRWFVHQDR